MSYEDLVLYGEPTEQQNQKALEVFTAWKLNLVGVSAVRQFPQHVMSRAMRRYYEKQTV